MGTGRVTLANPGTAPARGASPGHSLLHPPAGSCLPVALIHGRILRLDTLNEPSLPEPGRIRFQARQGGQTAGGPHMLHRIRFSAQIRRVKKRAAMNFPMLVDDRDEASPNQTLCHRTHDILRVSLQPQ